MDYVTRQFINLAKRLRKELRKSLSDLQQSIAKLVQATEQSAKAQQEQAASQKFILAKLEHSATTQHHSKTSPRSEEPMHWLKLAVEVGTLVVVATYTFVSTLQLIEMKRSTEQTTNAVNTNLTIIKSTFAAYVTVEFSIQGGYEPVTKTQRGYAQIKFANYGRSKTYVTSQYSVTEMRLPSKREIKAVDTYDGTELVPGDTSPQPFTHHHPLKGITEKEMDGFHDKFIAFKLSGHFRYADGFGETIDSPICEISTAYQTFSCDQLDYYLPYPSAPNR